MKYVNPDLSIPEILNILEKSSGTVTEKANMLRTCWPRKDVKFYIDFMYNGDLTKSRLSSMPDYKPSTKPFGANFMTLVTAQNAINSAISILHMENADKAKFDKVMVKVLESISAEEAALVVNLFTGKKHRGGIKSIFKEAYPEFFRTTED
jgi:hypothetical protein